MLQIAQWLLDYNKLVIHVYYSILYKKSKLN